MSFHDVRFPDSIAQGAQFVPGFSTSIVTSSGGQEQRNGNWSLPRRRYNVGTGLKRRADTQALLAFYLARAGRLHGFRFKDWLDYTLLRQGIGSTGGGDATWQIYKGYTSGPTTVTRPLTRLVSGTVSVWVNGAAIAAGAGAGQYQVNLGTGIITLGSTLAATTGQLIEAACDFDVPCRFDTDDIALSLRSHEIGETPDIPILELRE